MNSILQEETDLQIRTDGDPSDPALIYLPGIHGDWTLFTAFRDLARRDFFVIQITFPRTLSWSLQDYARAVSKAVARLEINRGWVLAESYSSQVAWAWWQLAREESTEFQFSGLILAGGFVKYPIPLIVRAVEVFFAVTPWRLWKALFWVYFQYSRFRLRNSPDGIASASEFVARRNPLDIAAIRHRLRIIAASDPRSVAETVTCPVYLLAGTIDPVVPTWPVLRWLRRHCPGFKSQRIIWPADHNVLGTEPAKAFAQIKEWIQSAPDSPSL